MKSTNAAIETLEHQRAQLTNGLNSITEQQKHLESLKDSVESSTTRLAKDKAALIEIDNALNILRAGESA